MPVPNIDTFENDIREEIKNKEASVGDIASASGTVANTPIPSAEDKKMSRLLIAFLIVAGLGITAGFSYLAYVYVDSTPTSKEESDELMRIETKNQNTEKRVEQKLSAIAPSLAPISRFVSEVSSADYGTTLHLTEYSQVFAFMLRTEQIFAREIFIQEFANHTGTSTLEIFIEDVTKSNQNMRVIRVASSTLVYAFFGEEYLAFASSTDNILRMRGAIIK